MKEFTSILSFPSVVVGNLSLSLLSFQGPHTSGNLESRNKIRSFSNKQTGSQVHAWDDTYNDRSHNTAGRTLAGRQTLRDDGLTTSGRTANTCIAMAGFTLIELLVVVLIIGILAAVAVPQYTRAVEKARVSEAKVFLKALLDAEDAYVLATGEPCGTWSLEDLDITLPGTLKKVSGRTHIVTKNFEFYGDECAPANNYQGGVATDFYADRIGKNYSVRVVGKGYDGGGEPGVFFCWQDHNEPEPCQQAGAVKNADGEWVFQ